MCIIRHTIHGLRWDRYLDELHSQLHAGACGRAIGPVPCRDAIKDFINFMTYWLCIMES